MPYNCFTIKDMGTGVGEAHKETCNSIGNSLLLPQTSVYFNRLIEINSHMIQVTRVKRTI